jgi:hypothetical protein
MPPIFKAACLALALCGGAALAQPMPTVTGPTAGAATLAPDQLDQLVAPIALYPDPLLTDILAAATYPAQVVEAQRFVSDPANAGLQGQALADAGASHGWDQSVQALLPFPQVLQMMDSQLPWTEHLGQAFMAQQADVMNAVQALRHQARQAGTLGDTPQQYVVNDGDNIAIDPASQQQIFVPAYDPDCVYGVYAGCSPNDALIGWNDAVFLPYGYWQWGIVDWGARHIRFGRNALYGVDGGVWRHAGAGGYSVVAGGHPFNYAPANHFVRNEGFAGRGIAPVHYHAAPSVRAPVQRAPAHAVAAVHGEFGGVRR